MSKDKVLHFSRIAWDKMWGMTLRAKGEVQGFGYVDEHDPCRVVDFFIVNQVVTAAGATVDQDEQLDLFLSMRDKGIAMNRWRVWWHSHADMKTFFSDTDEGTIKKYASDRALWSVVTNHADARRVAAGLSPTEVYIRADCFDPANPASQTSPQRFTILDCGWSVPPVQVIPDAWFAEQMTKLHDPPARTSSRSASRAETPAKGIGDLPLRFPNPIYPGVARSAHAPWAGFLGCPPYGPIGSPANSGLFYEDWRLGRDGFQDEVDDSADVDPEDNGPLIHTTKATRTSGGDTHYRYTVQEDGQVDFGLRFINGCYLHGVISFDEAAELGDELDNGMAFEEDIDLYLARRWGRQEAVDPLLTRERMERAQRGFGPMDPAQGQKDTPCVAAEESTCLT